MRTDDHTDTVTREPGSRVIDLIIRPSPWAKAIIINYPGFRGDINGYNSKYAKLGKVLSKKVGAFIQMPNTVWPNEDYQRSVIDDLRAVCKYARTHASVICGSSKPSLYLMGFSAGAGAVAAVADEVSAEKILLMAPSGDAAQEPVRASLATYAGEVYIVIGENDSTVGPDAGQRYFDMARSASRKELVVIPNCDHQFRGTVNGKIMRKAPLWAFAGDKTFPSPKGGIVLY